MSELVDTRGNRRAIRNQLLATASMLALATVSANMAKADDSDHPTVWIELGGQLEALQGTSSPVTAPFMFPSTVPDVYGNKSFVSKQSPSHFANGGEGKIFFQPESSSWFFSAAVRYGRSNSKKYTHYQGPQAFYTTPQGFFQGHKYAAPFSDTKAQHNESHTIIDFSAGRDIGIGLLGREGNVMLNTGVRFAQFSQRSSVDIHARPEVNVVPTYYFAKPSFHQYTLSARDERGFRGIGPSLSVNGSTVLLGSNESGDLAMDWGINGAVMFGRQKASVSHNTQEYYLPPTLYARNHYAKVYENANHSSRSRSLVVPNLGGFAGLSMRKANAKISLGYRADFFFGAVDTGIDARRTSDLGFHGPFATISIGLGG